MCDALQLNWKLNPNIKPASSSNGGKGSGSGNSSKAKKKTSAPKADKIRRVAAAVAKLEEDQDPSSEKYTLRACSIQKRMEAEHRKAQAPARKKRGPKPRPKSAPMSKYRRKTANLRERQRMGEINTAFERLRDRIPNPVMLSGRAKCEKLTKINILHVTINYIRAMENLLTTGDSGVKSYSEMVRNPIRPDEKRNNKFEQYDEDFLMEETDGVEGAKREGGGGVKGKACGGGQQASKAGSKKKGGNNRKGGKKSRSEKGNTAGPQPLRDGTMGPPTMTAMTATSAPMQQQQQQLQHAKSALSLTSLGNAGNFFASSSGGGLFFSDKSCLETSSDSGISTSSSSVSPTAFSSAEELSGGPGRQHGQHTQRQHMLDPLLGGAFKSRQQQQQHPQQHHPTAKPGTQSSSLPIFDATPIDQDEMLREVVGLVDSLHDVDFPDIAFEEEEDPFEWMLPKPI